MKRRRNRQVLFSGIRASGNLTIGNYFGAIKNWVALQDQYDCLFCLVDAHTITERQDPLELRRRCYDFVALYLACGVDPKRNLVFVQSHVPAHSQLAWILGCVTYVGELDRMTQFKEKAKKHKGTATAGLYSYPVLMAADVLLYETALVPIGEDQRQHLELARRLARRFNGLHGDIFTVPEAYFPKIGARIMSLQEPARKMDKSDGNAANYIAILDPPATIAKKIKRAVTDSGSTITYDESKPALSNLIQIFAAATDESVEAVTVQYEGANYGRFKADLAEVLTSLLRPIQQRYEDIRGDEATLTNMLAANAEIARTRSRLILSAVHNAVGFISLSEA